MTVMRPLHHATIAKAKKMGVALIDAGHGVYIATDTKNGDAKSEGTDGKLLLEQVLAARPDAPKPKAKKVAAPKKAKARKPAKSEDEDGEGDEEEGEISGSIVRERYRAIYKESAVPNSNDDDLAGACYKYLTNDDGDLDLVALASLARDNGLTLDKWSHLNNGQKRMCLGNALRGLLRKGTDVVIGTTKIRGAKQAKA